MAATTHPQPRSASLLVTGFAAFPCAPVNPTEHLLARLGRARHPGLGGLACHLLPVTWAEAPDRLKALIERHRPAAIVMFGLAARADRLRLETRARNTAERLRVDAGGAVHRTGLLAPGPVRHRRVQEAALLRAEHALRRAGIPARRSQDAGAYLCNAVLWSALDSAAPGTPVLFVHVPKLRRRTPKRLGTGRERLDADDLLRAAVAILRGVGPGARAGARPGARAPNRACVP